MIASIDTAAPCARVGSDAWIKVASAAMIRVLDATSTSVGRLDRKTRCG